MFKATVYKPPPPQQMALGGIVRDITTRIFGYMPRRVKQALKKIGDLVPTNFVVMRAPVQRYINTLLNVLSWGQWESLKAKHNYDDFFHLSLVFDVGGQRWRLEKNEIVNLIPYVPREGEETFPLGSSPDAQTLNEIFMETIARVGEPRFYRYSAWEYNCQRFIMDILDSLKLNSPKAQEFILQDIDKLVEELNPNVQEAANELTDLGGAISTIGQELGLMKKGGVVRKRKVYF